MDLYKAVAILEEIAAGDQEREAYEEVMKAMDSYRAMYEGAEKRLMRYRDVARRPDLTMATQNKDFYRTLKLAREAWLRYCAAISEEKPAAPTPDFEDWLFMPADTGKAKA